MRPVPALVLAALAALALLFTSSADDHRDIDSGPSTFVRFNDAQPGPLTLQEATRTLRAAGWPDDRLSEALRVAGCESGWRPTAVGTAGEVGLFQLHPINAGRFEFHGVSLDPSNPVHNAYIALRIWERDGWEPWSCRPGAAG